MEKLKENNSKIYYNGSKWKTNNCGEIEIVGKSIKSGYYICKFEDGTIFDFTISNIKRGSIKNPNFPSVVGVGFIGVGKNLVSIKNKATKEYGSKEKGEKVAAAAMWKNLKKESVVEKPIVSESEQKLRKYIRNRIEEKLQNKKHSINENVKSDKLKKLDEMIDKTLLKLVNE